MTLYIVYLLSLYIWVGLVCLCQRGFVLGASFREIASSAAKFPWVRRAEKFPGPGKVPWAAKRESKSFAMSFEFRRFPWAAAIESAGDHPGGGIASITFFITGLIFLPDVGGGHF